MISFHISDKINSSDMKIYRKIKSKRNKNMKENKDIERQFPGLSFDELEDIEIESLTGDLEENTAELQKLIKEMKEAIEKENKDK